MAGETKTLEAALQKNSEDIASLTKTLGGVVEGMKSMRPGWGRASFGAPHIRKGEDPLSSRGFSFVKMIGVVQGDIPPEEAKVEVGIHQRLYDAYCGPKVGIAGYKSAGKGNWGTTGGRFMAPLGTNYMFDEHADRSFRQEMKDLVNASVAGADWDEMGWIRRKSLEAGGYGRKDLSWLQEALGGALVAPPEQGELIELLRNKEALVNAGARTVPLPPQGRMVYPRQTAASNTYWVGENAPITRSDIGTGEVTMQAKKLAVLIRAPNELIRFASPAAEALMRDDMTKSLALGLDLAGLEGLGGDTRPLGIIQRAGINRITSSQPGPNGDLVTGVDIYRMVAAVEESNAEFEAFVMRPKTLYKYYQLRGDAVAQGDQQGPFLFHLIREAAEGCKATLAGYPVTKSTQVSQSRAKGTATNLTYVLGGMFSDVLIGMFGAIEFAATTLGDTPFINDQTWVRGILSADVALRHEAAFVLLDNLDTTLPVLNPAA